jgi:hypothetical protein
MIASAIEKADQGTLWKEEQLANACPPCFNFSNEDEDRTIRITVDRNMQHAQLKRHTLWGCDVFQPKFFVVYGRKKFDLGTSAN